jgi:hypothetical protein
MRLARRLTSYIFQLYNWDKPCAMDFQIRNQRKIKPVILALHYHHDMKVKPEAATAVIELLMMGGRMPKTC